MQQNGGDRRENSPLLLSMMCLLLLPGVLCNLSLLKKKTILSEFVASVSELSLTTLYPQVNLLTYLDLETYQANLNFLLCELKDFSYGSCREIKVSIRI